VTSWFSDRILIGRVIAGLGGYLASHLIFGSAEPVFMVVGTVGVIVALAAILSLAPTRRMAGGAGLALGGFAAGIGTWFIPFAPYLLVSMCTLPWVLTAVVRVPAPARSDRVLPRLVALGAALTASSGVLALASHEAWVVWPEAFSRSLSLEATYGLLSEGELELVRRGATIWAWSTVVALVVPLVLAFVGPARFGVRRILSATLGLTALAFFTLQIGTASLRWNLVEHGEFATDDYPWFAAIRAVQALLFAAAFLIAAIRLPDEAPDEVLVADPTATAEEPAAQPG